MHDIQFLFKLVAALSAALIGGSVARLFGLPVIVGYLVAGVIVGPHTPLPTLIADTETVRGVSKLGVALLMFAVGVQFSLKELMAVRRTAIGGGLLQIILTAVLGFALGRALGWSLYSSLFLGCALSLSSTAIMMRVLEERAELGTSHGSVLLGILVVQDLALVPMVSLLSVLPELARDGMPALAGVAGSLVRAGVLVALTLALASKGVPRVLQLVARTGSRELFLLSVLCICLTAAAMAHLAGLSLEIGAFLAGLVISESDYSPEALSQIRPLRDVFASLFFVSIGMLLDPSFVVANVGAVAAVVLLIVLGKAIIAGGTTYLFGWHGRTAILVGLGLANIGEFSFVLAALGMDRGLVTPDVTATLVTAALVTILTAPFGYSFGPPLYRWLSHREKVSRWLNRREPPHAEGYAEAHQPRAVVLGGGRVGQHVSAALRAREVPHVVVDLEAAVIATFRAAGVPVIFGDAASEIVLAKAQVNQAELVFIALPDAHSTETAIRIIKCTAPAVPVVARVHRGSDIARMRSVGADVVIHAEFEAALAMIHHGLIRIGFDRHSIDLYLEALREARYFEREPEPLEPLLAPDEPSAVPHA